MSITPLNGFSGSVSIVISGLPTGVTVSPGTSFSVTASAPQTVTVSVASTVAVGSYTVDLSATSGSISHSGTVALSIQTPPPPGFSLTATPSSLILVPGAQGSFQISMQAVGGFVGDAEVQISGLPAGTTISPSGPFALSSSQPQTITVGTSLNMNGGSYTLSIAATSGSIKAPANESLSIAISTPLPSRASYVRTDDTPFGIVYDKAHKCVYETNPVAGTVDVISSETYQILRRISVPAPAGIDITPDDSLVFVGTSTQAVYALNASTMALTKRYIAPNAAIGTPPSLSGPQFPIATPNDTALLSVNGAIIEWNPATGQTSTVVSNPPIGFQVVPGGEAMAISADHSKVIVSTDESTSYLYVYDVASHSFSPALTLNGFAYSLAVNSTGTQFAVAWTDLYSFERISFLDANLNFLETFDGGGSLLYSSDDSTLYQAAMWYGQIPGIGTISTTSFAFGNLKPLFAFDLDSSTLSSTSTPMATDKSGRVFGSINHGLAIDDMTDPTVYTGKEVYPSDGFPVPDAGPVGQATQVEIGASDIPISNIWFGPLAGVYFNYNTSLAVLSAPLNQTGPVNIRVTDIDGAEAWMPQAYTYGTVLVSQPDIAFPASGGATYPILGFGIGNGAQPPGSNPWTGTTVTLNGATATLSQGNEQFAEALIGFPYSIVGPFLSTPAMASGAGDIVATTPWGSSTLQSAFHAVNVTTYPMDGTPNSMVYDPDRQQLYIAVSDHIEVFSLASNSFLSAIQVPALNNLKQVTALALTPDGKSLLAANWSDGSVAIINPDSTSDATAVAVASPPNSSAGNLGPDQLAATNTGLVFVGVGIAPVTSVPLDRKQRSVNPLSAGAGKIRPYATSTGPEPNVWVLDLDTMIAAPYAPMVNTVLEAPNIAASPDGSLVCFSGPYIPEGLYDSATKTLIRGTTSENLDFCSAGPTEIAFGPGQKQTTFITDSSAREIGISSVTDIQQAAFGYAGIPLGAAFDSTGALLYVPDGTVVALFDAHTGEYRENVALPSSIESLSSGDIALDSAGARIFVFTQSGSSAIQLTAIQMDELPLAVGSISASGSSWKITGTGFTSQTQVSVDGNPVSAQLSGTNQLEISSAPSLGSAGSITISNPDGHSYTYDVAYFN